MFCMNAPVLRVRVCVRPAAAVRTNENKTARTPVQFSSIHKFHHFHFTFCHSYCVNINLSPSRFVAILTEPITLSHTHAQPRQTFVRAWRAIFSFLNSHSLYQIITRHYWPQSRANREFSVNFLLTFSALSIRYPIYWYLVRFATFSFLRCWWCCRCYKIILLSFNR